jgi:hypothetical protein
MDGIDRMRQPAGKRFTFVRRYMGSNAIYDPGSGGFT